MLLKSLSFLACCCLLAPEAPLVAADTRWAPWVEPDFPFFSTSLDLRSVASKSTPMNVIPRGLVLNLGHDCWACFDTELLRVAAIWTGQDVTDDALAQLSYQAGNIKTVGGQSRLPKPHGPVWWTTGVHPGWQIGGKTVSLEDPREPQPSAEEPGRGPLPADVGRFRAVRFGGRTAVLEYTVVGAAVQEWMTARMR